MNRSMQSDPEAIARELMADETLSDGALYLRLSGCTLRLLSNTPALLETLTDYFSHVVTDVGDADIDIIAIERDAPELSGLDFIDWKREPGKSGRKDAYVDLPAGRLIRKVRTGMLFLQSESHIVAAGPCLENDNQVINFINAQYMNWLQHRGWLICHASGLVSEGRCLGIAGFSGGGKSTLMLHLLDHGKIDYLTNDRLFIQHESAATRAVGIPKLPRVNPGTIVHNPTLHGLIPDARRAALLQLPPRELWELEEKFDVHMDRVYGPGRIVAEAPLGVFLVLNWRRDDDAALVVEAVDLSKRRDLLGAIMKSPGPFYQYPDGAFLQDDEPFDEQAYLDALTGVTIYEARGGVDFDGLIRFCLERLFV
ncbi:MAG: HprK-related kinase B [Sedimenticola sp.]